MGQASSSRRESSPSRESGLREARFSRRPSNSNEEVCLFSPFHCQCQDPPDVSNSIQNWLSMDTTSRDKHVLHAKHCVLTPYFLFSKEDEYDGKVISWLQQKQLIPKQSEFKLLSDKHINVADCAEEAMDMILSLMDMSGFLYDVFQVVEQTKECHFLSDALNMVKNCHLITVLLNKFSNNVPSNKLPRDDTGLIILVLLNQAMNHIQKVGDQTEAFEQCIKDNSRKCDELKIKGNGFFNAKKYNKACLFYSQAIKLRPFDAVLYGNRAQSYLSAAKYREALSDARRAICLNPSWEKGYFRYAKAYYHLGFHDKAIAINHQAQEKCSKKSELIQQALLFTKGRSSSPSSQPTIKRQRISSAEVRDLTSLSEEVEEEYSDLPDLIDDDTDDELHKPGPSTRKEKLNITNKTSRSTTLTDDMISCKRVQCACSHCSPRNNTLNMRLKRTSDTVHKKLASDGSDWNNKSKHKTLSKSGQGKNPEHSRRMLNEACALSDIDHPDLQNDDDECCTGCAVLWANGKDNNGAQSARPLVNHHHMHDDDDDTKDSKIQANNDTSNNQTKSRNTRVSRSSSNKQHASELLVPSLNSGSTSSTINTPSSRKPLEVVSNNYNMCRDCDECECGSSSSLSAQGKTNTLGGISSGEESINDDMNGSHSRDHDDDDNHDDEPECICGLCSINGDDDDDDQWEDIDDDDDSCMSDIGMPELDDFSDDDEDDDEDDDDEDDDDDDDDEDAFFFNPFFHMFGPPPPLPPQLVLGGEILLMALIRQFIEEHSEFQSEDTPPGALPEVIESLIKKKVTKDLLDSSSSCCICQNDYALEETITCLPCNHVYHGPCITTWLKMHATCPTCRDVLPH